MTLHRRLLIFASLAMVTGLAGCGSGRVPWTNPSASPDQAQHDYDACRRYADNLVDPAHGADQAGRSETVVSRGEHEDDKRRRAMYVRSCMEARGYRPASR